MERFKIQLSDLEQHGCCSYCLFIWKQSQTLQIIRKFHKISQRYEVVLLDRAEIVLKNQVQSLEVLSTRNK